MTDKNLVLFCAFRYALGRKTYIVSFMCRQLRKARLSKLTKEKIIKEIDEAHDLGMSFDRDEWLRLRNEFKEEIASVNKNS